MNSDNRNGKTEKNRNLPPLDREEAARLIFRNHQAQVEPDAGFAARVVSRLERRPVDLMSSVALKLLPATLALILILAWFAARTPGPESSTAVDSSDDLVTWILEDSEVAP